MKRAEQIQLRKELREAGANQAEIASLLPIATELAKLHQPSVAKTPVKRNWGQRLIAPLAFGLPGLAIGMLLIIMAQAVLPTSWLYPAQELSDNAIMMLRPHYRADVMMKRAQQVNELVASHASTGTIRATLADYTKVAGTYKASPHASYQAFEYCENMLNAAATSASPEIKQAIQRSLDSLQTS